MIAALLVALTLVSPPAPKPPPLKQCVNACEWDEDEAVWVCGYWERPVCMRKELECSQLVEGTICENNMRSLGYWNSGDGRRVVE